MTQIDFGVLPITSRGIEEQVPDLRTVVLLTVSWESLGFSESGRLL
jgi:hypothetical protein